MIELCEYGCGQEAKYKFKNGKKCCSKNISLCPSIKNKIGNKNKGNIMPESAKEKIKLANIGKTMNIETKEKIRAAHINKKNSGHFKKGEKPWNKGLTKHTDKRVKIISQKLKGKKPTTQQKKLQSESKKKLYKNIENHPSYKGEYYSNNIPLYDTFAKKLTIEEMPERDIIDQNILTVICNYCKKRFIPKASDVSERVRCLKGTQNGECRLYCSNKCKNNCSIFRKRTNICFDINKSYTQSEYKQFREYVFKRDNYKCQYCGEKAEHVHHERPQKTEPFFALDLDYAWSVCKKCHYKYGHRDECSTGNLSSIICNGVI